MLGTKRARRAQIVKAIMISVPPSPPRGISRNRMVVATIVGLVGALTIQFAATTDFAASAAATDVYPQFLSNGQNRVNWSEKTLNQANVSHLTLQWTYSLPGSGPYAPPVAGDVAVFESFYNGSVEALSQASGHVRWKYLAPQPETNAAAVTNSVVFVGEKSDGILRALNKLTGALLWTGTATPGIEFFGTNFVTVSSGIVYTTTQAFDERSGILSAWPAAGCGAATCAPLWIGELGGGGITGVAVDQGLLFADSADGYLYVFGADGCGAPNCNPLWKGEVTSASDTHVGSIVIAGGIVYVGDQNSNVKAFRVAGCGEALCQPAWSFKTGDIGGSNIVADYGILYVGDANGLQAFDTRCHNSHACQPLWTDSAAPFAQPFIANYVVYASSGTTLLANDALTGDSLWQTTMPGSSANGPIVANGAVYVALVNSGDVLAYDLPGTFR